MVPKSVYVLLLVLPVIAALAMPYVASAAINSNVWSINILKGPLISCTGAGAAGGTDNKNCQSLCDLIDTVANVIYFGIGVVIWIIAPIMVAWSGINLLISRGSAEKTSQARKMITGVVIGLLIVLCAYLIISVFVSVLNITGVGGFTAPSCSITASS